MEPVNLSLRIRTASSFSQRLLGWLCIQAAPTDSALFFPRCNAVHTCFMRFAIDVVFVDSCGRVLRVVPDLRPWRASACRPASGVLELAAGVIRRADLRPGMRILDLPILSNDHPVTRRVR
ncbi:MAG: hypothetical protein RL322_2781 [Pseudomonadota bacterium]|jgi:uncharacterized membrane protein (UPF0127 family)